MAHWMELEGDGGRPADGQAFTSRFSGIGARLSERRQTTGELMASMRYDSGIDLELLTGVHERRVAGADEDSYTLARDAARDALAHAGCAAEDLDVLIVSSISRHVGGMRIQVEPPVSVRLKHELGADRALSFDLANACAGMLTGVFLLNDLVRQGRIRRGMVVSGEYITELGRNAAQEIRDVFDDQLASLTLGDAGAAAIVERAPAGTPGIDLAGFTTLSEYSRLCVAFPATIGPGTTMHTQAHEIHVAGIEEAIPRLAEALAAAGLAMEQIDYLIPHQTSARAIEKGSAEFAGRLGGAPKHVVITVDEFGNTASTTHFVALWKYLTEGRLRAEDRVLLLSLASGLEVGVVIFTVGQLVERYAAVGAGHGHGH